MIKKYINLLTILFTLPAIFILCFFYIKPELSIFILVTVLLYAMFLESPTKSSLFFEVGKIIKFFFKKEEGDKKEQREDEKDKTSESFSDKKE